MIKKYQICPIKNLFSCAAIVFGIAAIHATKPSENKKIKQ